MRMAIGALIATQGIGSAEVASNIDQLLMVARIDIVILSLIGLIFTFTGVFGPVAWIAMMLVETSLRGRGLGSHPSGKSGPSSLGTIANGTITVG